MILCCLLVCIVSGDEKSVIFLIIALSVIDMSLFSGCFKDFLFIIGFLQLDYDMPSGLYVCILLVVS